MSRPADLSHVVEVRVEELAPVEADGAADDVGGGRGQEAQDRQRADGLATARLTHQSDDLPAPDLEGGFVDHADGAGLGVELDAEAPHLEERGRVGTPFGDCAGRLGRLADRGEAALGPAVAAPPLGRGPAHAVAHGVTEGVEGEHRHRDDEARGDKGPRVGEQRGVVGLLEHAAPAGRRGRRPQAEEAEPRGREEGGPEGDGDAHGQAGQHVGQNAGEDDASGRRADRRRRLDEGLLLDSQGLAPDEAGEAGREDEGEGQGDVVHPAAEYRHDGQGEDERREGQAGVGAAHEQVVDAAAAEARHEPDHQRQDEGDAHRLEGDLHGDPGAVDQPGEDVATEVVGAEPVAGADAGVRVGQVLGVRVVGRDPRREDRRNRHEHQPPKAEQDADAGDELQQAPVIGPRPAQRLGVVAGELGLGETHETLTLGFRYP